MRTHTERVCGSGQISRALLHVPHQASARVPTWHAKVRAPRTPFEIPKLKSALRGLTLETICRRFDVLHAQVHFALSAMVRGMDEHSRR